MTGHTQKKYSRKWICEAIRYWKKQLKKMNESAGAVQTIAVPRGLLYGHGLHTYDSWFANAVPVEFVPVKVVGNKITCTMPEAGAVPAQDVRPGRVQLAIGDSLLDGELAPDGNFTSVGDRIAFIDECGDRSVEKFYSDSYDDADVFESVPSEYDVYAAISERADADEDDLDFLQDSANEIYELVLDKVGGWRRLHSADADWNDVEDAIDAAVEEVYLGEHA